MKLLLPFGIILTIIIYLPSCKSGNNQAVQTENYNADSVKAGNGILDTYRDTMQVGKYGKGGERCSCTADTVFVKHLDGTKERISPR